jgi:hypothetical protein
MRIALYAALAMIVFAADSILCRVALRQVTIDAPTRGSFASPALLAAAGGVVFLAEAISIRLALSTILALGGIAPAVASRERALRHVEVSTA